MKIRKGFVSNSSSSSFVCDVCNHNISGWDLSLYEAGMYQCINGHTFCEDHAIVSENASKEEIDRYEIPAISCPCCSFIHLAEADLMNYLLTVCNITKEQTTKVCKDRFKDYEEFNSWIKKDIKG